MKFITAAKNFLSNKRKLSALLIGLSVLLTGATTHRAELAKPLCQFFPANKLRFPIRPSGQINQFNFEKILSAVQGVYAPIFRQMGKGDLRIVSRWTNDDVNAFANIVQHQTAPGVLTPFRVIEVFGGLARHPMMTPESLMLVLCHEIGHHLGGYPYYSDGPTGGSSWASVEGQSDYFSTSKCARIVFGAVSKNVEWAKRAPIDFNVRVACNNSFRNNPEEAAICMRSSMAGLALGRTLATVSGTDWKQIDFKNTDRTVVDKTFESHPQAQCRLDTYLQGALCQMPATTQFSNDPRKGACTPDRLFNRGVRPACWYKDPFLH